MLSRVERADLEVSPCDPTCRTTLVGSEMDIKTIVNKPKPDWTSHEYLRELRIRSRKAVANARNTVARARRIRKKINERLGHLPLFK